MNDSIHVVCPKCDTTNRVVRARADDSARCGRCKAPLFAGAPIDLTEASFDLQIAGNDLPVVVDFWAPWCGPCRVMAPAYAQAAQALAGEVRVAKLDTERAPGIAARFGIRSIPTLVAFRRGREIARQSGAMDFHGLVRWMRTLGERAETR